MQYALSKFTIVTENHGSLFSCYSTRTGIHSIFDSDRDPTLRLLQNRTSFSEEDFDPEILSQLLEAGFLVSEGLDEVRQCEQERSAALDADYGLRLGIMTTLACNFSCPYCFQYQGSDRLAMPSETQDQLLRFCERTLRESSQGPLIIKWYGGEALLELEMVRSLSRRFKALAKKLRMPAFFSLYTNGYHLDRLTPELIDELGLSLIQVTLDGPREIHNQRRALIDGGGTFDLILENIAAVSKYCDVITVRINIDFTNYREVPALLLELEERGILDRCMYSPVAVHSNKGTCSADRCVVMQPKEWARVDRFLYEEAKRIGVSHRLADRYPSPWPLKCSAQVDNAFMIDPKGNLYKCITDASMTERAHFNINSGQHLNTKRTVEIRESSPFGSAACENCRFLPLCQAGCPTENVDGMTPGFMCTDLKYSLEWRLNEYVKEFANGQSEAPEPCFVD